MEDPIHNGDEDTLELASKTWKRVIDGASKSGFREGIKDGSMSVFQDGFDRGYKDAYRSTFLLGAYKGLANCYCKDTKHPPEIENILQNSKRGICYLCEKEIKEPIDIPDKHITDIEICQKEHSDRILKILSEYFDPLLKECNANINITNL